jgi:hypothetical protein
MQKIYEDPKTKYAWNFPALGLSYFEIPKTGSSTVKTVLFRTNYKLAPENELNVGGGKLAQRFPNSFLKKFGPDDLLDRVLIIYRDPIARAKSAYRSIFIGRQQMQGSLSEYFSDHFPAYLESPENDGLLNHHKPMTWFFPQALLDDPRTLFVETSELNTLPQILDLEIAQTQKSGTKMPHLLNVNKTIGEIDMTDDEIKEALGSAFEADFKLYARMSARA